MVVLRDADVAAELARAGLIFVERHAGDVSLPTPPWRSPASCLPEHGRFDAEPGEVVHVANPDMPAVVNASWHRMAVEYRLFNEEGEFLLDVDYAEAGDPDRAWVRVKLRTGWDIASCGVDMLRDGLGAHFTEGGFVPGLTVLSLDQRMMMTTTVWGDGTVSTIVIRPDLAA